jgi:hypothetical protein
MTNKMFSEEEIVKVVYRLIEESIEAEAASGEPNDGVTILSDVLNSLGINFRPPE